MIDLAPGALIRDRVVIWDVALMHLSAVIPGG